MGRILIADDHDALRRGLVRGLTEGGHEVAREVFNRTVGLPWAQSRALLLSHFGETFPVDEFQASVAPMSAPGAAPFNMPHSSPNLGSFGTVAA